MKLLTNIVKKRMFLRIKASIMFVLFLAIFCNSNFFWHTHFINNRVIVHSHFYWEDNYKSENNATHTHTYKEISIINILNSIIFNIGFGLAFIAGAFILLRVIFARPLNLHLDTSAIYYFLRGPPVLNYN